MKFRIWLTILLSLLLFYVILLFLKTSGYFSTPAFVIEFDAWTASLMNVWHLPAITGALMMITFLGKIELVLFVSFLITVCLGLWKKNAFALPLWITIIGTEVFVLLGKMTVLRPRPEGAMYLETSASFPSGHAAISMAFYGLLAYLLACRCKNFFCKIISVSLGAILILIIGFSRLYLGVHFASDVFVGYSIGLLWLIIGIFINEWLSQRERDKEEKINNQYQ